MVESYFWGCLYQLQKYLAVTYDAAASVGKRVGASNRAAV